MNRDHEASQSPQSSGRSTTGKSSGGARRSSTPRNRSGAVMNLQRAAGNRAVAGMMSSPHTELQRIPAAEPVVVQREIKDEDLEFYLGTSDSDEVTRMLAGVIRKSGKRSATKEMPDRIDDEGTTSGTKTGTKKSGTKKKRSELVKKKADEELTPKSQAEIDKKARIEFVKKQNKEKEQIAAYNLDKEQSAKEMREAWAKNQDAILNGGQNPFNKNKSGSWLDRRKPGANQKTANKWLEMTKKKKDED